MVYSISVVLKIHKNQMWEKCHLSENLFFFSLFNSLKIIDTLILQRMFCCAKSFFDISEYYINAIDKCIILFMIRIVPCISYFLPCNEIRFYSMIVYCFKCFVWHHKMSLCYLVHWTLNERSGKVTEFRVDPICNVLVTFSQP